MPLKIEAVTVCVNYSDFLAQTLPRNAGLFDHYLVVTSHQDRETIALCHELGIECRPTDLFDKDGGFAKGRAIDWGLGYLRKDAWICHLDADIWLPPATRLWLAAAELDEQVIYGCDRFNCPSYDAWTKFIADPRAHHQHKYGCMLVPPPFPMGARISYKDHNGYCPIGFFQLWHSRHGRRYPLLHTSCEHTDVLHSLQWPRDKRRLLEEIYAVHLESEPSAMGVNWAGRKTRRFGPDGGKAGAQPQDQPIDYGS